MRVARIFDVRVMMVKLLRALQGVPLKRKLQISFVLIAIIPAIAISVYNYASSSAAIEHDLGTYHYTVLSNMSELVDKQLEQVNFFTEGLLTNEDLLHLLRRREQQAMIEDNIWLNVYKEMERQFKYASISSYMLAVMVVGENGFVSRSGPYALYYEAEQLRDTAWFEEGKSNRKTMMLFRPIANSAKASGEPYVIPVTRAINDINKRTRIGSLTILLSERFFSDLLNRDFSEAYAETYLIDGDGFVIAGGEPDMLGRPLPDAQLLGQLSGSDERFFVTGRSSKPLLVVRKQSEQTELTLVKLLPLHSLERQKNTLLLSTLMLLLATLCFVGLFSLFLTWNFTKPIRRLIANVKHIAAGNFTRPLNTHTNDELGQLGGHIERMALQIQTHIHDKLHEQEERKRVEMRMLQAQINPHFLYNTLSSIKWMAAMQRAEGIEEMAGSLGRLLHAAADDIRVKISLEEELKIVDEYISIQRIRYKGKVKYERSVQHERLLRYAVPRFALQPIVENAIFHGIEPKRGAGRITVEAELCEDRLLLRVRDNGAGMRGEAIAELYGSGNNTPAGVGLRGIGLRNVMSRLKLLYGENASISIASEERMYTEIVLNLPAELLEHADGHE